MPIYSAYEQRNLASCIVSDANSSYCAECVHRKQGNCDVLGPSPEQLRKIAAQYLASKRDLKKAEAEAEAANARVRRLRQQKKLWFEKMMRAVSRSINNIEDLERIKKEEANREASHWAIAMPDSGLRQSSTKGQLDSDFIIT